MCLCARFFIFWIPKCHASRMILAFCTWVCIVRLYSTWQVSKRNIAEVMNDISWNMRWSRVIVKSVVEMRTSTYITTYHTKIHTQRDRILCTDNDDDNEACMNACMHAFAFILILCSSSVGQKDMSIECKRYEWIWLYMFWSRRPLAVAVLLLSTRSVILLLLLQQANFITESILLAWYIFLWSEHVVCSFFSAAVDFDISDKIFHYTLWRVNKWLVWEYQISIPTAHKIKWDFNFIVPNVQTTNFICLHFF